MSTKFTRNVLPSNPPPPLLILLNTAARWMTLGLLDALEQRGYPQLTEAHISLLANLDCGATHASAVAQRMGLSRQALNRTIREMEALGFLRMEQDATRKNQKVMIMTEVGERLALDARTAVAIVEGRLRALIGSAALAGLRRGLELPWGTVPDHDT